MHLNVISGLKVQITRSYKAFDSLFTITPSTAWRLIEYDFQPIAYLGINNFSTLNYMIGQIIDFP